MESGIRKHFFATAVILAIVVMSTNAYAATFGDMLNTLKESVQALGEFLKLFLPVAGLGCLGFGLFKFIQNNPQDTMFDKMIWIIVGACLLAIAGFVAAATGSLGMEAGGSGVTF